MLPKRSSVSQEQEEDPSDLSPSHLVSFLTNYDETHSHSSSSEPEEQADDSDVSDEIDPDDESTFSTPIKRSKVGLVGNTPSSKRSTPSKKKTPFSTPRKPRDSSIPGSSAKTRKRIRPNSEDDSDPTQRSKYDIEVKGREEGFIRMSKADNYFLSQSQSKRSSLNSYSTLAPPLNQKQYDQLSSSRSQSSSKVVQRLMGDLESRFEQWEMELEEGFNLLFYGFGSKRRLLNKFVSTKLIKKGHCVVVNGHFPQMGIKDILVAVEDSLGIPQDMDLGLSGNTPLERMTNRIYSYFLPLQKHSDHDGRMRNGEAGTRNGMKKFSKSSSAVESIREETKRSKRDLYLLIHNIDSPGLRTSKSLSILSVLTSNPRIHLLASFDHIHTPLLFSQTNNISPSSHLGFNFLYHNITTYDDYTLELSYHRLATSRLTTTSTGISEEAVLQILKSVPPMAVRLFKLLVEKQLSGMGGVVTSLEGISKESGNATMQVVVSEGNANVADPKEGEDVDKEKEVEEGKKRNDKNQIIQNGIPTYAIDNDLLQGLARERFIAREEDRYNTLLGEFKDHGVVLESLVDSEGRVGRWIWVPLGRSGLLRVLQSVQGVE
ncbi:hypothetical protein TREMEDRAFT_72084 [Tremella mesenterica DSM 1558]|uniref:uncharacterized protein n=1 Tax=Tremella mesenterica (strain ATCC 24925 / CBS 8224 / DSM 1558 / NBRC 9311 / NRRL Y-6157 / RJB 2259-6 / UBC 559-6) TaxID=578456 RepID=UPI0003F49D15|nr:uncharacterized protein TREMEDRAFT_72084 [Tremella mesenterica DSM 1558]EIW68021.1 hypothetical protein TREMEDRAFT_72084 [Tremella mesenterica DSM 1558]